MAALECLRADGSSVAAVVLEAGLEGGADHFAGAARGLRAPRSSASRSGRDDGRVVERVDERAVDAAQPRERTDDLPGRRPASRLRATNASGKT